MPINSCVLCKSTKCADSMFGEPRGNYLIKQCEEACKTTLPMRANICEK